MRAVSRKEGGLAGFPDWRELSPGGRRRREGAPAMPTSTRLGTSHVGGEISQRFDALFDLFSP